MGKREQLERLYRRYSGEFSDREVVPGDGNADTELLLIGEAPGRDEVRLLKPFVGMAGKNLEEFLGLLGVDRASIYITNAVKYRLSAVNPRTGRVVNRPATRLDITASRAYLINEINIIGPKYIVTLGNVPLKAVTGDFTSGIGKMHGCMWVLRLQEEEHLLYPLYHPASILYNGKLKKAYTEDIKRLRSILSGEACAAAPKTIHPSF